ncbi:MAG: hypothetical protein ACI8R9_000163 [Paraglaciecola sp.]|jgi:hypothetical protein
MLKNIRLHIEQDEEKQRGLEEQLAQHMAVTRQQNINVFKRQIPSLLPYIEPSASQNISLICNKFGQFNIVDYGLGRVLYGFLPQLEIARQVDEFKRHASYISFEDNENKPEILSEEGRGYPKLADLPAFKRYNQFGTLPCETELIVVFGLGLGEHIKLLLESTHIQHVIIYEPELQYFNCSVMVTPWKEILDRAKAKGTAIYLQLGKDGRDLIQDIEELRQHYTVNGFFYFQHYHNPVFNSINHELANKRWVTLLDKGMSLLMEENNEDYCPVWTPIIDLESCVNVDKKTDIFVNNLKSFQKYFPEIHQEFKDYQPNSWLPVVTVDGQVNIIKMDSLVPWYGDKPEDECFANFAHYSNQPNKDGLVLGYNGTKLKDYLHYRFVKDSEKILNEITDNVGVLPNNIKSIIIFGVGAGYQIQALLNSRDVEKLFICEPNRDFFFASLFAIDWADILERVDKKDARIYINIGDDGTNLFRDLLHQFYAIGPYVLSHTYFYQSYYNSSLNYAISQLREQLQVVISMGEYFDHARFGIAHTKEGFLREYPHMVKSPGSKLAHQDKEIPIFLVGNGPSLDTAVTTLKEIQDQGIIVSCGTSLQVLRKNGIVPDFHAEIEQNRSTFDWAARVDDFDFLKKVSLISCNGIHPDTCNLYRDVFLAFKEGESSTVSTLASVGEANYETLQFSFPTVSNFALNFFIKLGFKQLYLVGVDLGFSDQEKHHSKQSGYYDNNGKSIYNYSEKDNTSLIVPGNFRQKVFTKQEFKIAKMVMEQSIKATSVECYNTSDGAKISGSMPLRLANILLVNTPNKKRNCLKKLKEKCFVTKPKNYFLNEYKKRYSDEYFLDESEGFRTVLARPIDNLEEAENLIEQQKAMLFDSYRNNRSLFFYLLYGTVNYANVVFNKVAYSLNERGFSEKDFNTTRKLWLSNFDKICFAMNNGKDDFDSSSSFFGKRVLVVLRTQVRDKKVLCVTNSIIIQSIVVSLLESWGWDLVVDFISHDSLVDFTEGEFDIVLHFFEEPKVSFKSLSVLNCCAKSTTNILTITNNFVSQEQLNNKNKNLCYFYFPGDFRDINSPFECNDYTKVVLTLFHLLDFNGFDFITSKLSFTPLMSADSFLIYNNYSTLHYHDLKLAVGAIKKSKGRQQMLLRNGTRTSFLGDNVGREDLNLQTITDQHLMLQKNKIFVLLANVSEGKNV